MRPPARRGFGGGARHGFAARRGSGFLPQRAADVARSCGGRGGSPLGEPRRDGLSLRWAGLLRTLRHLPLARGEPYGFCVAGFSDELN